MVVIIICRSLGIMILIIYVQLVNNSVSILDSISVWPENQLENDSPRYVIAQMFVMSCSNSVLESAVTIVLFHNHALKIQADSPANIMYVSMP